MVHVLHANVLRGRLDKHGLVEASPNVLRRVNKVLDSTCDVVDSGLGWVRVDDELGGFKGGGGESFFCVCVCVCVCVLVFSS